jgi:bacteriorhodopsin
MSTTASLSDGDIPSTIMDSNMRGRKNSSASIWLFMALYLIHVVVYLISSANEAKNHVFVELRRKMFIPLLTFGTYYLLNNEIGWFVHVLLWVVLIAYMVANIVCVVPKFAEGKVKKLVFTVAHASAIVFWIIYWICQMIEY